MVDIIRRGQIPEEKVHEVTCGHCNSLLSFKQGEAKLSSNQWDGDYLEISCPVCKHTVSKQLVRHPTGQFIDH